MYMKSVVPIIFPQFSDHHQFSVNHYLKRHLRLSPPVPNVYYFQVEKAVNFPTRAEATTTMQAAKAKAKPATTKTRNGRKRATRKEPAGSRGGRERPSRTNSW
ncbi:unnamed protein product [Nesidiocoris tenuis]|uniref:Uncharacterized protein n=1 Tax=Nesidiocoris tenuis TaxID=355587 RepID=A0A6H5G738_9HEMI|nr:unnamed protein product [Nesidiocoris tenuis]